MNSYYLRMKNDITMSIWADYTERYRNYEEKIDYIDFMRINKEKSERYKQEIAEVIAIADMKDIAKITFEREKYSW